MLHKWKNYSEAISQSKHFFTQFILPENALFRNWRYMVFQIFEEIAIPVLLAEKPLEDPGQFWL